MLTDETTVKEAQQDKGKTDAFQCAHCKQVVCPSANHSFKGPRRSGKALAWFMAPSSLARQDQERRATCQMDSKDLAGKSLATATNFSPFRYPHHHSSVGFARTMARRRTSPKFASAPGEPGHSDHETRCSFLASVRMAKSLSGEVLPSHL